MRSGATLTAKQREEIYAVLLETIANGGGNVTAACKKAGCSRKWAYEQRDRDPEFGAAFRMAIELGSEGLIDEATRRGKNGVRKPIYHNGVKVGSVIEYSDRMLELALRVRRPALFKTEVANTYPEGVPTQRVVQANVDATKMDPQELVAFYKEAMG